MECKRNGKFYKKLTFTLIIVLGVVALYWSFNRPAERRVYGAVKTISWKLDLTAEQKKELERLSNDLLATRKIIDDKRRDIRKEFAGLAAEDKLNKENLLQLVKAGQEQVDFIAPRIVEKVLAFTDSLDENQRKIFIEEIKERSDRKRDRKIFTAWF